MKVEFNSFEYFSNLTKQNKLTNINNYFPCRCTGISSLGEMVDNFKKQNAFVCVDDTNDGSTNRVSGGFFNKRTVTVFILKKYKFGSHDDFDEKINLCREIYKQFLTRLIKDTVFLKTKNVFIDTDRVYYREIGEYFLNGCTGLYFMFDVSYPQELIYNNDQWED